MGGGKVAGGRRRGIKVGGPAEQKGNGPWGRAGKPIRLA